MTELELLRSLLVSYAASHAIEGQQRIYPLLARVLGALGAAGNYHAITYRPGGVTAGDVVATWAEVQTRVAAVVASGGHGDLFVDSSLIAPLPAPVPAASGLTDFGGVWTLRPYANGAQQERLDIETGAQLRYPRAVEENLILIGNQSAAPSLLFPQGAVLLLKYGGVLQNNGTRAMIDVPGGELLAIGSIGGAIQANGVPVVDVADGGQVFASNLFSAPSDLLNLGFKTYSDDWISGTAAAVLIYIAIDASFTPPTIGGFLGSVTYGWVDKAGGVRYDDTLVAPPLGVADVQAAIDELKQLGNALPLPNGVANPGVSNKPSRDDHIHPAAPPPPPSTSSRIFDDFVAGTTASALSWISNVSGAGAGVQVANGPPPGVDAQHQGVVHMITGSGPTGPTSRAGLRTSPTLSNLSAGGGSGTYEALVALQALSLPAEEYFFLSGFTDDAAGTRFVNNAITFLYDRLGTGGSANWRLVANGGAAPQNVDSGVPVVAGAWIKLRIELTAAGAAFFIDGAPVGVIAQIDLPDASEFFGMETKINKLAGSGNLFAQQDYVDLQLTFNPPR